MRTYTYAGVIGIQFVYAVHTFILLETILLETGQWARTNSLLKNGARQRKTWIDDLQHQPPKNESLALSHHHASGEGIFPTGI